jgi:hypothetical protein
MKLEGVTMAKTNFSKAEESMGDALQKLTMQQLLELADIQAGTVEEISKRTKVRLLLIKALRYELSRLYRHNPDIYKKLKIKKSTLEKWITDAKDLSDEDWKIVVLLKEQVEAELKQASATLPTDTQLVEKERKKHINKRYNVNEKWLPLK